MIDCTRTQLVLETERPEYFLPLYEHWNEINRLHSLLKLFAPIPDSIKSLSERDQGRFTRSMWGCYSAELQQDVNLFFNIDLREALLSKTQKLVANFSQCGWSPYVGYRRISSILPKITFTLFDPDLTKEAWLMSFRDGEIVDGEEDYSILSLPRYYESDSTILSESIPPWHPKKVATNPTKNLSGLGK